MGSNTCYRHRTYKDYPNKYVSDITLGPFALNYISNLIRAKKSFGKTTSIETFQKKFLSGTLFADVDGIERTGLQEIYDVIKSGRNEIPFTTYLYADGDIPEQEYITQQKHLTDELAQVDARIAELDVGLANTFNISDDEFLEMASYFLLEQRLTDKRFVDYEGFIKSADPKIVRKFITSVIQNFCI